MCLTTSAFSLVYLLRCIERYNKTISASDSPAAFQVIFSDTADDSQQHFQP